MSRRGDLINDVYVRQSTGRSMFSGNTLIVNAHVRKTPDVGAKDYFFIGISDSSQAHPTWVLFPNDELDDLITALLYAREVSRNPELRK